jgi:hypothetical protein
MHVEIETLPLLNMNFIGILLISVCKFKCVSEPFSILEKFLLINLLGGRD